MQGVVAAKERAKYEAIWAVPEYSNYSPGLENVQRFMDVLKPRPGSLIDIGCGSGKAGLEFQKLGFFVEWLDLTDAALDPAVNRTRFMRRPLWDWDILPFSTFEYGFCCDVMEHIPPEFTMQCLSEITRNCDVSWLHICNMPDQFGAAIGQTLHLTVQPFVWWRDRLREFGTLVEARDLCGNSLFVVER